MISAYVGLPRSGKSYSITRHVILPALEQGRIIYSNIPMNMVLVNFQFPNNQYHYYDPDEALKDIGGFFSSIPHGALIIIDEMMRFFPAGKKPKEFPVELLEFFTMHGHKLDEDGTAQEIILCGQNLSQIAACIRELVETTYMTTKLSKIGLRKRYKVIMYQGAVTGQRPPQSLELGKGGGKYIKEIYQYYKSHTRSKAKQGATVMELETDKRGNVFFSRNFVLFYIFGFFAVPFCYATISNIFNTDNQLVETSNISNEFIDDFEKDVKKDSKEITEEVIPDNNVQDINIKNSEQTRTNANLKRENIVYTKQSKEESVNNNGITLIDNKVTDKIKAQLKREENPLANENKSHKWALVGEYNYWTRDQYNNSEYITTYVVQHDSGFFKEIPSHECTEHSYQIICKLDGKTITWTSGNIRRVNAFATKPSPSTGNT